MYPPPHMTSMVLADNGATRPLLLYVCSSSYDMYPPPHMTSMVLADNGATRPLLLLNDLPRRIPTPMRRFRACQPGMHPPPLPGAPGENVRPPSPGIKYLTPSPHDIHVSSSSYQISDPVSRHDIHVSSSSYDIHVSSSSYQMSDPRLQARELVYYAEGDRARRTNAAFLLGCYCVLMEGWAPEEAAACLERIGGRKVLI